MSQKSSKPTMDIIPWPTGSGFEGGTDWWKYVLSQNEENRLDFLFMAALSSCEICNLLLNHDPTLFKKFELSDELIDHLSRVEAHTLKEFVQGMASQKP